MNSIRLRYFGFGALLLGCSVAAAACSSDGGATNTAGTGGALGVGGMQQAGSGGATASGGSTVTGGSTSTGGVSTTGGSTSTGGASTTGGAANTGGVNVGGQTSSTDIKIIGSTTQCPNTTPQLPAGQIASCAIEGCTGAHCVPASEIPQGTDTSLLQTCPDGSFCTPDDFIATQGKFQVKKCTSLEGAEGRCLSTCIPQVNDQISTLPKDVCHETERCAPCWNPIDGADTKACSQGCDTGPPATKVVFTKCGADKGVCVPKALVPAEFINAVPVDTCTKTDYVCAPIEKAKDFDYQFPQCAPSNPIFALVPTGPNGQKGGCVPTYIVPQAQRDLNILMQDTCQTGELCAPCVNPLSMPANQPTGACPLQ